MSIERNGNTIQILGKTETETQIDTETDDGLLKMLLFEIINVSRNTLTLIVLEGGGRLFTPFSKI